MMGASFALFYVPKEDQIEPINIQEVQTQILFTLQHNIALTPKCDFNFVNKPIQRVVNLAHLRCYPTHQYWAAHASQTSASINNLPMSL